jgi:hypothetical protein
MQATPIAAPLAQQRAGGLGQTYAFRLFGQTDKFVRPAHLLNPFQDPARSAESHPADPMKQRFGKN